MCQKYWDVHKHDLYGHPILNLQGFIRSEPTVGCSWIIALTLPEMLSIQFRRLIHWTAKQSSRLCRSREHISTALNSSGGMLYISAFDAAWMQLLGHRDPVYGLTAGWLEVHSSAYIHFFPSYFQFNIIPLKTDCGIFGIQET